MDRKKAYMYTRVSTAMQVDGYSLDAQEEEIRRYCEYHKIDIVGSYSDATVIIGLKQNPTNGRRFSPIFLLYRAFCGAKHRMPL